MSEWRPATQRDVEKFLMWELALLHPSHRVRFESIRVPLRSTPISNEPGGIVFVVAEHNGRLLYWSDVEGGWELEFPATNGGIGNRGCNQFELRHIVHQLFGEPDAS